MRMQYAIIRAMRFEQIPLLVAGVALVAGLRPAADARPVGVRPPPQEAKPHLWRHWMNGDVSRAGIPSGLLGLVRPVVGNEGPCGR